MSPLAPACERRQLGTAAFAWPAQCKLHHPGSIRKLPPKAASFNVLLDGTCNETVDFWEMPVDLPAHSLRHVPLTCGFTVSAPSSDVPLDLGSSRAGTATIDGLAATALVFSTTDCRTGCGRPAWFELHSILWRPDSGDVGFAVWYLSGTTSGQGVSATNGIILPESGWTDILHSRASWSLDR